MSERRIEVRTTDLAVPGQGVCEHTCAHEWECCKGEDEDCDKDHSFYDDSPFGCVEDEDEDEGDVHAGLLGAAIYEAERRGLDLTRSWRMEQHLQQGYVEFFQTPGLLPNEMTP